MGYLKQLATGFVWICTFLAAITFIPGLPPTVDFTPYEFKLPEKITVGVNYNLNEAEKLFVGQIKGPESFDSYDGVLYFSLHGGRVSKLEGNKIVDVVKFSKKCAGIWEEEKCGRPLGLKFDKRGNLYIIEAYTGVYKADVKTGKYERIIDANQLIEGKPSLVGNAIDIAKNGDIYWTVSTTEYKLYDGIPAMLSDPVGRAIHYNAATKKNEVLLENLGYSNGLKLSSDESSIIIAETLTSRLIKYYLKGPKTGKAEIFIEGLPGCPDNIHSDSRGNYLVSLVVLADAENPILSQSLAPHNNIRKMLVRLLLLLKAPFKLIEEVYPNYYTKRIIHWFTHFESASFLFEPKGTVLRIDPNGKILDTLICDNGSIFSISSAYPLGDYLWLGSPFNNFLGRVRLDKVLPDLKNVRMEKKISTPPMQAEKPIVKSTTTTPKPTTTTSKPTTTTSKPTTTTPKPTTTTPKPTTTTPKPTTTSKPITTPPSQRTVPKPAEDKPKKQPKAKVEPVKKPAVKPVREEVIDDQPKKQILRDEM